MESLNCRGLRGLVRHEARELYSGAISNQTWGVPRVYLRTMSNWELVG